MLAVLKELKQQNKKISVLSIGQSQTLTFNER